MHAAQECWDLVVLEGTVHGFRNAQTTVLAPTGTIGFMMDCDTTGVEPDLALVKFKKLVGGGMMKIVNNTVPVGSIEAGLHRGGDSVITRYIDENGTIEGAPVRQTGTSAGVRLRIQAATGNAVHSLHGPHQNDERGSAVYFRRHFQNRQCAREVLRSTKSPISTCRPGVWE